MDPRQIPTVGPRQIPTVGPRQMHKTDAQQMHTMAADLDARVADCSVIFGDYSQQFVAIGAHGLLYAVSAAELEHKIGRIRSTTEDG